MGTIGIRPVADRCSLAFHVDVPLVKIGGTDDEFRFPFLPGQVPDKEWGKLTQQGHYLAENIIARCDRPMSLDVRPRHCSLTIPDAAAWPRLLPKLVADIRIAIGDPKAKVRPEPPYDRRVPQWHIQLLEELGLLG